MKRSMVKIVVSLLCAAAALVIGVLVYFKCFVTPLDKEGMIYQEPPREGEQATEEGGVK